MAIKDILVHVDNAASAAARMDLAVDLARANDAHLTGLYVDAEMILPTFSEVPTSPVLVEAIEKEIHERAEMAEASFNAALDRGGYQGEWRRVQGYPASSVITHGRYTDLIVCGQGGEDDPLSMSDGVADAVLLEAGRPVLVVPWIGRPDTLGERVLVAWNAGREAARAVNDALPLLVGAKKVQVVTVNAQKGAEDEGEIPGVDITLHLSRHGVNAETHQVRAADIDAGDLLLSLAADATADLIVMGGYGRSRFREVVLGGVTRHVLAHMTVPVLLSH